MAKFISRRNPVSVASLKRKVSGTVVFHHNEWEDVKFTRTCGGWLRERVDFFGLRREVVTSVQVAAECNKAFGFKESWACIY